MRHARASTTLAVGLVICGATSARAAPGHFELVWSAPETCPSQARVEQRVERILNRPVNVREDDALIVRADVSQPQGEHPWRVVIETDNGQRRASRLLEAASCDELANATALLIAILIEPNVEHAEQVAAPPPPEPPPDAAETSQRPVTVPSSAAAPVRFSVGAFAGAVSGLVPAWSFGAGIDAGVAWKALRWNVSAAYWLPVEQSARDSDAQGARFQLVSGQTKLCLVQPIEHFSAGICSGAHLAFLRAEGFGPGVRSSVQRAEFVSVSAGALLGWAVSNRLSFVLQADALRPLGSRRFVFEGSAPAEIHSPRMGVQIACGAQFSFGTTENPGSGPTLLR
jgi:hypothetical protein